MIKRIFIIGFMFLSVIGQVAFAQVYMDQGKIELTVSPGETVSDVLKVTNTSDEEVRMRAYLEDFAYELPYDGAKEFFPAGTLSDSLKEWISFSPQVFTMRPGEVKEISYSLRAPADAQGGHYGVLFLEKEDQNTVTDKGIKIVTRVGTLFFIESTLRNQKSSFKNITAEPHQLLGEIHNEGDVILIASGVFYIIDGDGLVVDRGEMAKVYLPPQATVNVQLPFTVELAPGSYSAVVTFDFSENHVLVKEIDFRKTVANEYEIINVRD